MHRLKDLGLITLIGALLVGCGESDNAYIPPGREVLYWKNIECEIEDSWFNVATPVLCSGWVRVRSNEYDLERTFDFNGYRAGEMRSYVRDNTTITCEMYSWVLDDTGEVTRRMLNKITE